MVDLEHAVEQSGAALRRLSDWELRQLNRSLRQLTLAQRAFAHETLEWARGDQQLSMDGWNVLVYLIERWPAHDLGLKLALIAGVERLGGPGSWPDDVRSEYPALTAVTHQAGVSSPAS